MLCFIILPGPNEHNYYANNSPERVEHIKPVLESLSSPLQYRSAWSKMKA